MIKTVLLILLLSREHLPVGQPHPIFAVDPYPTATLAQCDDKAKSFQAVKTGQWTYICVPVLDTDLPD